MDVDEIAPGLWRWTALHPDWTPDEAEDGHGWEQEVGCYYFEADDAIVLIDPLIPADEERERFLSHLGDDVSRAGKPVAILLTVPDHQRSAAQLVELYGAEVWAEASGAEKLKRPAEHPFTFGDALPGEVVAIDGRIPGETIYWIPRHGALVTGDVILGDPAGGVRVCPASWLPNAVLPAQLRADLSALLDLPVERVLVTHGEPVLAGGHDALAAALAP